MIIRPLIGAWLIFEDAARSLWAIGVATARQLAETNQEGAMHRAWTGRRFDREVGMLASVFTGGLFAALATFFALFGVLFAAVLGISIGGEV